VVLRGGRRGAQARGHVMHDLSPPRGPFKDRERARPPVHAPTPGSRGLRVVVVVGGGGVICLRLFFSIAFLIVVVVVVVVVTLAASDRSLLPWGLLPTGGARWRLRGAGRGAGTR